MDENEVDWCKHELALFMSNLVDTTAYSQYSEDEHDEYGVFFIAAWI